MQQLLVDYPWLVIIGAILLGMFIMWLLEMFVLRRTIKSNLTDLEASLKQRDSELKTAQSSLADTSATLKTKTNELQSEAAARAAAESQASELDAQLKRTTATLTAAQQSRQELETNLNNRTAELTDQRSKYGALTAQADESAAQVKSLSEERDQLRANLAQVQSELNDHKGQYRSALSEVAKLSATAAATAAVVKGLEHSKTELTDQVTRLNTVLDETNANVTTLETELASAKARGDDLDATRLALEAQVSDLSGVKTTLEGQVAVLEGKNSALDAKLTAGALAASEIIRLLEQEKAGLKTAHAALQEQHEHLQRLKALDDADLAELKLQFAHVNESLGITTRDKEAYQQTLSERVTELGKAQTELVKAKADNTGLLGDVARFTARAAAAAALIQELEANKRDLSQQVEQLRTDLDAEHERVASLTRETVSSPEAEEILLPPPGEDGSDGASSLSSSNGSGSPANEPVLQSASATGSDPEEGAIAATAALAASTRPDGHDSLPLESPCPQDLSVVHGVGRDFEQRLYDAGIGTYWDLSQKSEDELADILKLEESHRLAVNLAIIRGDALRLARETKSQKRTWTGGIPDDFDALPGIGKTYEGRLYAAGICTYEALSQCSVEQLAAICQAPHLNNVHYKDWIEQARQRAEARRKGA